jgi:hypothetical protein
VPLAITQTPTYPVVTKGARLTFTPGAGGNFVRVWCTDAPVGSDLRSKIEGVASAAQISAGTARFQIFEGDAASAPASGTPFDLKPDVPGKYVIAAQEYTKGASAYGGAYQGDPRGFTAETKLGSEASITVVFGDRVTIQLGVPPDTATLVLWVWDSNIRATTLALHGEHSPAIAKPSTAAATTAARNLGVVAGLGTLIDATVTSAIGSDYVAMINDFGSKYNAHIGSLVFHAAADTFNGLPVAYGSPGSKAGIAKSLSKIFELLTAHMKNDKRDGNGTGGGLWHTLVDSINLPAAPPSADMSGSFAEMASIYGAYEHHRTNVTSHVAPDGTALTTPALLFVLQAAFIYSTLATGPTAAATENPGAVALVNLAGAKKG